MHVHAVRFQHGGLGTDAQTAQRPDCDDAEVADAETTQQVPRAPPSHPFSNRLPKALSCDTTGHSSQYHIFVTLTASIIKAILGRGAGHRAAEYKYRDRDKRGEARAGPVRVYESIVLGLSKY